VIVLGVTPGALAVFAAALEALPAALVELLAVVLDVDFLLDDPHAPATKATTTRATGQIRSFIFFLFPPA
jgi:hypothetical protein